MKKHTNIIHSIYKHALERPDDIAIITPNKNVSWAHLEIYILKTAFYIYAGGVRAFERVGIQMENEVAHLITSLALTHIGACQFSVTKNTSQNDLRYLKENLRIKKVLTDYEFNKFEIFTESTFTKEDFLSIKKSLICEDLSFDWAIIQSSGTTGAPKFSVLTQKKIYERYERFLDFYKCYHGDVVWSKSNINFMVAKRRYLHALQAGAAICITTDMSISNELIDFINISGVTLANLMPSHVYELVNLGKKIPKVRIFDVGSAIVNNKLRREFKTIVNPNLWIIYATNETGPITIASPSLQEKVPGSVGIASPKMKYKIVDLMGNNQPRGNIGRIKVKGPGIIDQYLEKNVTYSSKFINGWFYTGDLGYCSIDGELTLVGREDDMMIFNGMNIYPAEIENVLLSNNHVLEVAAFCSEDERYQDIPLAAVILKKPISEKELIEYCKDKLGFKHPKRILILKKFPRNEMGKILKRELSLLIKKV